jgi:hypothetical protein
MRTGKDGLDVVVLVERYVDAFVHSLQILLSDVWLLFGVIWCLFGRFGCSSAWPGLCSHLMDGSARLGPSMGLRYTL